MLVPIYYVTVKYYNTTGRKYWAEIVSGPYFQYNDALSYIENNRTYQGELEIQKDVSVDLQPAYN